MSRKPDHYLVVQWSRRRDIDDDLFFIVTDVQIMTGTEIKAKKKEMRRNDYSIVAGPITNAECWALKKVWKRGNLMRKDER